jgi:hypothetical protein
MCLNWGRGRRPSGSGQPTGGDASIIQAMVIDRGESLVRTMERLRGCYSVRRCSNLASPRTPRAATGASVLARRNHRALHRAERGVVLAYLRRLRGYRRAPLTHRVSHWIAGSRW